MNLLPRLPRLPRIPERWAPRRDGDDDGISLIIIALTLVAVLGLGGLAIDGGRAYALRRQMQNAADAASLDATKVLDDVQQPGSTVPSSSVRAAAAARVASNGGMLASCKLVPFGWRPADGFGSTVDCPAAGNPGTSAYAGVYVGATQSQATFLVQVVGTAAFTASANATAQIGSPATASAPYAVCGQQLSKSSETPLMREDESSGQWRINPAAVGQRYYVYGPQLKQQDGASCGLGASWKGLVAQPGPYPLPGDWQATGGDRAGPTAKVLNDSNACNGEVREGCVLAIPICPQATDSRSLRLQCTQLGKFEIGSGSKDNQIPDAIFRGAFTVGSPGGLGGPADPYGAHQVSLTD